MYLFIVLVPNVGSRRSSSRWQRWGRQGRWILSFYSRRSSVHLKSSFFVRIIQLCLDWSCWLFLFLENVFFPCNVLSYLNVIEDHNLIGTLSEIEKHCETSPGIVSEQISVWLMLLKLSKIVLTLPFQQCMVCQQSQITLRLTISVLC